MEPSSLSLQAVTEDQLPRFKSMLKNFDLPTEDVKVGGHWFFLFGSETEILGTAGLEVYHSAGLLRSVSIERAQQGKGIGKTIMALLVEKALLLGLKDLYLLTTTARDFFLGQGFAVMEREQVPHIIKQTGEFQSLCPDSAILMHRCLAEWTEDDSEFFMQNADVLVPERVYQREIFLALLAQQQDLEHITELCCGSGELSEAMLQAFPQSKVLAMDASEKMLARTAQRLQGFGGRGEWREFRLEANDWRRDLETDAFVSSLAVHHLNGRQKRDLFRDLRQMLRPGGIFILADLVKTTRPVGNQIAAKVWDSWVEQSSTQRPELFGRFKTDGWNHYDDPGSDPIDQPDRLTDLLDWMREAGFVDVDLAWMKAGHVILFGWKEKNH